MEPKVSIIIPVYNVEPFLARCLDSVVGQTLRGIEIILSLIHISEPTRPY